MPLFRLITEDKDRERILEACVEHFPAGFTAYPALGCWQGGREDSLVIEIATDDMEGVKELAEEIAASNRQEAVLVQQIPASYAFVEASVSFE